MLFSLYEHFDISRLNAIFRSYNTKNSSKNIFEMTLLSLQFWSENENVTKNESIHRTSRKSNHRWKLHFFQPCLQRNVLLKLILGFCCFWKHIILKIYHNKVLCYGTLDFNCSIIALFLYKFSDVVLSFYDFSMAKVGHKIFWAHNRHDYDLQSGNVKFNKDM